jgi:hypothetical protein
MRQRMAAGAAEALGCENPGSYARVNERHVEKER